MVVLSCLSTIAQSHMIDKVYLTSWLHKVLWNFCFLIKHILSKLLFQSLYFLRNPYFFKVVIPFRKSYFWVLPPLFQEGTCSDLTFSIPVATNHSMNGPFSTIKEQLQPGILSNVLFLQRTGIVARRYHNL